MRNLDIVFHNCYTNVYSQKQCIRVPLCPPSNTHYFLSLIIAILTGGMSYLTVVLICTPLVSNDVEHLLMYMLIICLSLENTSSDLRLFYKLNWFFGFFGHFAIELDESLQIFNISLNRYMIWKYFFPFSGSSFHFID